MNPESLKAPSSYKGHWIGILLLGLIPLVTLVPVTPMPSWLTQDLVMRWVTLLVFFLCIAALLSRSKSSYSLFSGPSKLPGPSFVRVGFTFSQ